MDALERLKVARQRFEDTHWGQGAMVKRTSGKAQMCAVGGIRAASDDIDHVIGIKPRAGDFGYWQAVAAVALAIHRGVPVVSLTQAESIVVEWNDSLTRTLDQVLAAFDTAIANLEQEGST